MKRKHVSALSRPLFSLGELVATPGALQMLARLQISPQTLLERHQHGDWGELDNFDKHQNHFAVRADLRILSKYYLSRTERVWIITEADRASTTILLPDEY